MELYEGSVEKSRGGGTGFRGSGSSGTVFPGASLGVGGCAAAFSKPLSLGVFIGFSSFLAAVEDACGGFRFGSSFDAGGLTGTLASADEDGWEDIAAGFPGSAFGVWAVCGFSGGFAISFEDVAGGSGALSVAVDG